MYLIREVVNCRPGKVGEMVQKFKAISNALREEGQEPLRLMTDASGEYFWTVVAEGVVERIDDFFELERKLMANETLRATMGNYHELVQRGRREIYRIES